MWADGGLRGLFKARALLQKLKLQTRCYPLKLWCSDLTLPPAIFGRPNLGHGRELMAIVTCR